MIKTAFCVSYDWILLKNSLPLVYEESDMICLGLDKDRHAWSGQPFEFDDDGFYTFIKEIDKDYKIIVYEDDFSLPELSSRENCNRHRMLMAEKMGAGGWHVQVDADEYVLNFKGLVQMLRGLNPNPTGKEKPYNVSANLIPLIKKTETGYLYVDFGQGIPEQFPIATTKPCYERARHNGYFNLISPYYVIHETWARSENELWFKINNWGHASEELSEKQRRLSYFKLWQSLDEHNYMYVRNFHPANAPEWPSLGFIRANNVQELIRTMKEPRYPVLPFLRKLNNYRNVARFKALTKRIFR